MATELAASLSLPAEPERARRRFRLRGAVLPTILLLIVIGLVVSAVFAPLVAPSDPQQQDLIHRLTPPAWLHRGSWSHPLGTDSLGRDILSRMIYGSRITLLIIAVSIPCTAALGSLIGVLVGYYRGWLEFLVMRLADVQLALPAILFAVLLAAAFGPGLRNVIIIIVGWRWATYARVIRSEVLTLRERDYVLAAHAIGANDFRILARHLVPNVVNTVIVLASLDIAVVVLVEASLSFLGVGVSATTISWGSMVAQGRSFVSVAWWLVTFPGLAILSIALVGNLAGDWLRDRFDPRLKNLR